MEHVLSEVVAYADQPRRNKNRLIAVIVVFVATIAIKAMI